jgi:O-antigen/teichoic acid export membrane protein
MLKKTLSQVGIKFLAIACGIFITRWQVGNFSIEDFANYGLILSYNSIILMAVSWGLPQIIQKVFTNREVINVNNSKSVGVNSPLEGWQAKPDGVFQSGENNTSILTQNGDTEAGSAPTFSATSNTGIGSFATLKMTGFLSNSFSLSNFWTTTLALRLASYIVGLIIIFFTYRLSQTSDLISIIGIFTAQFILLADLAFRSIADSNNKSWQFSVTDLVGKLILVCLMYVSVQFFRPSIIGFALISILAYLISLLIDGFWQRKNYSWGKFDLNIIKVELGAIGFLTLADIINGLYSKTDLLFLRYFNFDLFQVASYANAYKLFEIATIIPGLTMPVLASMLRKKLNSGEITKKTLIKYYGITLGVGALTTIAVNIFAQTGIWLIDPTGKYESLNLLRILSLILIVLFPTLLSSDLLNVSGLEKKQFWSKFYTAGLALVLYIVLIPMYGGVGAALATLCFFSFELLLKSWYVWRWVE